MKKIDAFQGMILLEAGGDICRKAIEECCSRDVRSLGVEVREEKEK